MSYVTGFTNDIFISFAHADNWDGWVERFQDHLSHRLAQIAAPVTIWRDCTLRGTDIFTDEIFDQLKDSAILISIVSPVSIGSQWCQDERQKFEQFAALNGGFRVGNLPRAIKVVKTPLSHDRHRELFGTLGFEFYRREPQAERFREFQPGSPEFAQRLDELAQDLKRVLDVLRAGSVIGTQRLGVYVATTSSDLEEQRHAIARQIEDWGYSVLPVISPAVASPGFRAAVSSVMEQCVLSVHLMSGQRGPIPDDEEKSTVVLQYESAQASLLDRIVWIRPGSQPHSSVLSSLEQGPQEGVERLENRNLEYLKEVIEARLKRLRREVPLLNEEVEKISVYLVCDRKDHPFVDESDNRDRLLKLKSYLDSKGLAVSLPPVNPMAEKQRRKDHRATLNLSDAVVLCWGMADEAWFRENLRELITARTRRSNRRRLVQAIYFSAPLLGAKTQYRNQLDLIFEQFDDFHEEALRPLLDRLQQTERTPSP